MRAMERALELPSGSLNPAARAEDFEQWDSLGQLSLMFALDDLFKGKIADNADIAAATSVADVLDALRRHSLL